MQRSACSVDDCNRIPYAKGLCEMHYRRARRNGDPRRRRRAAEPETCAVPGCEKEADARGLCHGHYQRWLRNGRIREEVPLTRRKYPETCTVGYCGRRTHGKGLCKTHYNRLQRYGDVLADKPIRKGDGPGDDPKRLPERVGSVRTPTPDAGGPLGG